jgi:phosphoribosylformylglycinamidine cyclo-ligase
VYTGKYRLTDPVSIHWNNHQFDTNIGQLILSPTRTFGPVVKQILETIPEAIHGMVHCSGGGQTKCLKYIPKGLAVIKDNLFDIPPIFRMIQASSGADNKEMYQVFNMGCRLELFTDENHAEALIKIAAEFGIEAQITGRVVASEKKYLQIHTPEGSLEY